MSGDSQDNVITGCGGDDVISGSIGSDVLVGDGNCPTPTLHGADRIVGGPGNDLLSQSDGATTEPDGHRDLLDCGTGTMTMMSPQIVRPCMQDKEIPIFLLFFNISDSPQWSH